MTKDFMRSLFLCGILFPCGFGKVDLTKLISNNWIGDYGINSQIPGNHGFVLLIKYFLQYGLN